MVFRKIAVFPIHLIKRKKASRSGEAFFLFYPGKLQRGFDYFPLYSGWDNPVQLHII
jgi:hypothetical protein